MPQSQIVGVSYTLDEIIALNRAKNLVQKLQGDLSVCIEGGSLRAAATIAIDLSLACTELWRLQQERHQRQEHFQFLARQQDAELFLATA